MAGKQIRVHHAEGSARGTIEVQTSQCTPQKFTLKAVYSSAGEADIENSTVVISSTEVASLSGTDSVSGDDTSPPSTSGEVNNNSAPSPATTNDNPGPRSIQEPPKEALALKVLQIIETYGVNFERNGGWSWEGLSAFMPIVTKQIKNNEPVQLLLPGFPFKAPNSKDKVLGVLPDLGEELALSHLDSICKNIEEVYEHGAELYICSDGLVYNDLLGVSDEEVWDYGEGVRRIAEERELRHIKFIRLWDLLDHPGPWTKDFYLTHASCIRREMVYRYRDPEFEADMASKSDDDIRLTHSGYLKGVAKDLAYSPILEGLSPEEKDLKVQSIAKSMMARWRAYANALEANRKEYVRLSIHDSAGKNSKLSLSLLPQERGKMGYTPWHSVIAIELDGSYRTVHASEVRDTHDLVYVNGRPSHFRAKSDIFDWKADGLDVTFRHQYPTGIYIRPANVSAEKPAPSIRDLPMKKVRKLSQTFSPIVLRGFRETTDEQLFLAKGHELGEVLTWTFGQILKVKDSGETDKDANNVTSNEAMPMHFDGIFKFIDHTDPVTGEVKKVLTPPRYQYFTCISTAPKNTGFTLFANSRLFFRHLPAPWSLERLSKATWDMVNDGFWSAKQIGLPLVVKHKETGASCLRFHEPWTNTKFSKYYITIENDDQSLIDVIKQVVYDHRVCLRFEWEEGDLLINDNVSMLHTRTAFTGDCDREMWRIHFD
ncbi:putative pyoverdine/dityrosine biosynthesis protein [Westerdykella ornata]|uniref:Putative pyoverdine/dityrosine biosynthesis protein n=1 Tax=Westerdykella ornata TaxID=318751 RepID=A0A6A6JQM4_WESOR|nr:putative pyoverdine/dityrosine biosynthesis protein [Westerdykella ornata]KAF2278852.1 putative pyoverdine/dityrosine biosynthesis protein [Westerdykella ornata]